MAQCSRVRERSGGWRCTNCGAQWDADDDMPECVAVTSRWNQPRFTTPLAHVERQLAARGKPVHERLTIVCDDLRNARAPERLIREIENCIIELRTK